MERKSITMAVFRIKKTKDYTVMTNHHLRNTQLSLKAKGLLSLMLSLPENWDYTTKGLAHICKDGVDSICSAIQELEKNGYIIRQRVRNAKGQLTTVEYTILEQPGSMSPKREKPKQENPILGNPILEKPEQGKPEQENPVQLNTKELNTKELNTILSIPKEKSQIVDGVKKDGMIEEREQYRKQILENIEYYYLVQNNQMDKKRLDELVELILDMVCTNRKWIRIAKDDYPVEVVKSRFLKLNSAHIQYILDCMSENTTYIHNIKNYLLAALYNAPSTIDNYYSSLVNHDMWGEEEER